MPFKGRYYYSGCLFKSILNDPDYDMQILSRNECKLLLELLLLCSSDKKYPKILLGVAIVKEGVSISST